MRKLSDGAVFDAVNGLWLSGLYGVGAGAGLGLIVGAIVGTIVPIVGNLIGAFIGFLVGGIVGLPAGILGYAIGSRRGWCIASALSCFIVGSAVAGYCYASTIAPYQQTSPALNREVQASFFIVSTFALLVFTGIGLCLGNVIYNRLMVRKNDFYSDWAKLMETRAVESLSARNRAICLIIALVPVLVTYAQLTVFLCRFR